MQATEQNTSNEGAALGERALGQIGKCLRQGCVICIEHTPVMAPRFTPWQIWGQSCCYNGDTQQIYTEIDRCRDSHADHHIRLSIEDYSFRSRFTVMVHNPSPAN
ncbi:MAG: hypothetical protein RLZ44_681 [Pseudomonadota bacterium]